MNLYPFATILCQIISLKTVSRRFIHKPWNCLLSGICILHGDDNDCQIKNCHLYQDQNHKMWRVRGTLITCPFMKRICINEKAEKLYGINFVQNSNLKVGFILIVSDTTH